MSELPSAPDRADNKDQPKHRERGAGDKEVDITRKPPSSAVPIVLMLGFAIAIPIAAIFLLVVVGVIVGIVMASQPRNVVAQNPGKPGIPAQPPPPPPPPKGVAGKTTVDLIPLIDLRADTVEGQWSIAKNILQCEGGGPVPRIDVPYTPPAEYDFMVVFSQQDLGGGISLIMPNPNGGSFYWYLGTEDGRGFGFHGEPDKAGRLVEPIRIEKAYTTIVQFRKGIVTGSVNGKLMMQHKTDFRDLTCDNVHEIRDTRHLGIACDAPTVFHYVQVVEITGTGKKGR